MHASYELMVCTGWLGLIFNGRVQHYYVEFTPSFSPGFHNKPSGQGIIPTVIFCDISFTKILYTLIDGYKILKKISYFKMDHEQLQTNLTDNVNECIS